MRKVCKDFEAELKEFNGTFAWLHQFKRLRVRYERRADLHQRLLELASSIICLRRLRTTC